jgi:hypothetical protein
LNSLSRAILLVLSLLFAVAACSKQLKHKPAVAPEKVILFVGQDLDSISDYAASGYFPTPAGVTTYLAFYELSQSSFPAYGALGQDADGNPVDSDVDWGAGPLNAHKLAARYPESALSIGLNIAEGDGHNTWAKGGLADIAVGAYDANIRRLAEFLKSIDNPVYLRIGYEFDGAWNAGYEKTSSYISAYRRIVDVLRQQSVFNVAYVWQASASPVDDVIDGYAENIQDWYPGDDYVDWMALSWFLVADERLKPVSSQRQLADEVLHFARSKDKPVMVAESAPQGYDLENLTQANSSILWNGKSGSEKTSKTADDIWREWFVPFFEYIHDNADTIRAVAYISADWNTQRMWAKPYNQGYWGDSRVQTNSVIREKWLDEVSDELFWLHGETDPVRPLVR